MKNWPRSAFAPPPPFPFSNPPISFKRCPASFETTGASCETPLGRRRFSELGRTKGAPCHPPTSGGRNRRPNRYGGQTGNDMIHSCLPFPLEASPASPASLPSPKRVKRSAATFPSHKNRSKWDICPENETEMMKVRGKTATSGPISGVKGLR